MMDLDGASVLLLEALCCFRKSIMHYDGAHWICLHASSLGGCLQHSVQLQVPVPWHADFSYSECPLNPLFSLLFSSVLNSSSNHICNILLNNLYPRHLDLRSVWSESWKQAIFLVAFIEVGERTLLILVPQCVDHSSSTLLLLRGFP